MIRQTLGIKAGNNGDVSDGGSKRGLQRSKGTSETRWFDFVTQGKRQTKRKKRRLKTRRQGGNTKEQRRRKSESDRHGNGSRSQEEKEGETQEMEVAAGFGGRLYAVL